MYDPFLSSPPSTLLNSSIKLLLNKNANPQARAIGGVTPLHIAAKFGQVVVVEKLLEEESIANLLTDNGWSALHYAALCGSPNCVEVFLVPHPLFRNCGLLTRIASYCSLPTLARQPNLYPALSPPPPLLPCFVGIAEKWSTLARK